MYPSAMIRRRELVILITAVVLGLCACAWYGYQWNQSTHWTQAQLQKIVRVRIQGPTQPSGKADDHSVQNTPSPARIRNHLVTSLNKPWRESRVRFFASLVFTLIAGGMLILHARNSRKKTG